MSGDREYRGPRFYDQADQDGLVKATCWCESHTVGVTPQEIVGGKTRSCGEYQCDFARRKIEDETRTVEW